MLDLVENIGLSLENFSNLHTAQLYFNSCKLCIKMEFTAEELKLESSATKCNVCKISDVVKVGRETQLVIYDRHGTKKGCQVEMRCNNRSGDGCRSGHYFGYHKQGTAKILDQDILKQEYLVTSQQTANNYHFTNLPFDTLQM